MDWDDIQEKIFGEAPLGEITPAQFQSLFVTVYGRFPNPEENANFIDAQKNERSSERQEQSRSDSRLGLDADRHAEDAEGTFRPGRNQGPKPPPGPELTDPNGPDILSQELARFREDFDPLAAGQIQNAMGYGDTLTGLAADYADEIKGSDGYGGLSKYAAEMLGLYEDGGLTAVTKRNLAESRDQAEQMAAAERGAVMQNLQARGQTGGAAEALASMQGANAAIDRMSSRDLDTHALAQEQALAALERNADANREIMDLDRDVAANTLGYKTDSADTVFDISREMNDIAISAWRDIDANARRLRGDSWRSAEDRAYDASTFASNHLTGATKGTRDTARGLIGQDTSNLEGTGNQWTNAAGAFTPMSIYTPQPVSTSGGVGAAVEQGAQVAGQIANTIANNVGNESGTSSGGNASSGGNTSSGGGNTSSDIVEPDWDDEGYD